MTESHLASLHEDELYAEQRRRGLFGLLALAIGVCLACIGALWLIQSTPNPGRFTLFVLGLCIDLYGIVLVSLWISQPAQEKARRKRLVRRQALGMLPSEDE